MGGGSWSPSTYSDRAAYRAATGASAFAYTDDVMAHVPVADRKAHDTLNPLGLSMRESRDSDEHPNSTAVAVMFDVTGSMGVVPRELQTKLAALNGTVLRRGYLDDPQFLFGAIGDATCDIVPLQVGQFESDNRLDDNLQNLYLEGGGGGNRGESYGLALYAMARHTSLDSWEKRGKKGYLFLVGDECPLVTRAAEIKRFIGDDVKNDLTIAELAEEAGQTYEVFFLHINNSTARWQGSLAEWQKVLGDNVISLQDPSAICETIALILGLMEGTLDSLEEGAEHLREHGAGGKALASAASALVPLARNRAGVATASSGTLPEPTGPDSGGTRRL